ncbi:hypothetical protein AALP_AA3G289700 [Arabis alpina]|uniref:Cyclin-dependent kinase inhibitor domain-containing protein n=1 Tax=Arabis alpina TaxID=50452 RepID=A0A087HCE8_ARAAL|nr:hypothetical protein AALP_AA3G289700 [Arabis alpina]
MGICRKKSKISGDVVVLDFSQPSTLGFRTRAAKNLALLRLRSHSPSQSIVADADSFRYLQLRNRRLEKPQLLIESKKQQKQVKNRVHEGESKNPKSSLAPVNSDSDSKFEENSLDCESGIRSTRESPSTPCNLFRNSEAIDCSCEIEEFFEYAEHKQQRHFTEKYNFDIVADIPLPGRYEWVKVLP